MYQFVTCFHILHNFQLLRIQVNSNLTVYENHLGHLVNMQVQCREMRRGEGASDYSVGDNAYSVS